jgi:anti-sigma factor RsiW
MERDLSHREIEELLGAYALDAVDGPERDVVERHLQVCPRCRAEVAEHREVAAHLAHTGGPAPAGVWDRIAAALDEPPPPLALVPAGRRRRPAAGQRPGMWRRVGALAAAAAVGVVLGVAGSRIGGDGAQVAGPAAALERAARTAETDPAARHLELRSPDGRYRAVAVVLPDGRGYLVRANLPRLPDDRTYQLWAIVDGSRVSAGVLGPEVRPVAFTVAGRPAGLAITAERAGGVATTTEVPVVVGTFDAT